MQAIGMPEPCVPTVCLLTDGLDVRGGDAVVELDGGMLDVEFVVEACVEEALQDLCTSLDEERLDASTTQEREQIAHLASRGEAGDVRRVLSVGYLLYECRREKYDRWCRSVLKHTQLWTRQTAVTPEETDRLTATTRAIGQERVVQLGGVMTH